MDPLCGGTHGVVHDPRWIRARDLSTSTAGARASVWGHGAYLAPDWTADWLHREAEHLLARRSMAAHGVAPSELMPAQTIASVNEGLWYARSLEFLEQD